MSRFSDIDFDHQELTPIYGYWSHPLVPLERALESITLRIDQLPRYIKVAKQNCHYPSKQGLTHDESAAVYLYTMEWGNESFYRMLNQALRCEDRLTLQPWFAYLKLFDTALSKLPTVKGNIWRGVTGDISKNFKKNQEFIWWSVSSCSSEVNVIKGFLGKDTTLFMIEAVNGKNVAGYTNFPLENEVLLGPGTRLRVKSDALDHAGGLHVVHLEEMSDDNHERLPSAADPKLGIPMQPEEGANGTGQSKVKVNYSASVQVTNKKSFTGEFIVGGTCRNYYADLKKGKVAGCQ